MRTQTKWNFMREQIIDSTANVVTRYADVDAFVSAGKVPAGIISINEAGIPIDLLNSDVGADTTIVFFHGAIEPTHRLPVLSGQGISAGITANRIFVSDPSLYMSEELSLSWYAGNRKQQLQDLLHGVLEHIVKSHGSRRVVFFGGSGGGFASLYFSSLVPGSLAVVFNPQTDITRFHSRHVRTYANIAYGVPEDEYDMFRDVKARPVTDLCAVYSRPLGNTVLYMQNTNDPYHVKRHMAPFLASLHPDNSAYSLMDSWKDGHTPPPKELLTEVLKAVCSGEPWEKSIPDVISRTVAAPTKEEELSNA